MQNDEARRRLLDLLVEIHARGIQVLLTDDVYMDAADLFDEIELEEAQEQRRADDWFPEDDDDEDA